MTSLCPIDRDAQNLLEAASSGAALSVKVVTNIAANLIAFLAVLDFINAALSWLGNMVDIQGLSFQVQSLDLWRGWSWPVVTVGGHTQSPGQPQSQRLLLPCASAHLLLHPAASGLPDGRGLGGLLGGGGAAGDEAVSERVRGLSGALRVQAAPPCGH